MIIMPWFVYAQARCTAVWLVCLSACVFYATTFIHFQQYKLTFQFSFMNTKLHSRVCLTHHEDPHGSFTALTKRH